MTDDSIRSNRCRCYTDFNDGTGGYRCKRCYIAQSQGELVLRPLSGVLSPYIKFYDTYNPVKPGVIEFFVQGKQVVAFLPDGDIELNGKRYPQSEQNQETVLEFVNILKFYINKFNG